VALTAFLMEAFLRERQKRQQLGLLGGFFLGRAVGHELGKFGHLGAPASVAALVVDDMHEVVTAIAKLT